MATESITKEKIIHLFNSSPLKYFYSAFIVSVVSLILYYLREQIGYQSVSLVLLFVVSLLPILNFRPGQIFLAAVVSAFIWNYFFIPPHFTFRIDKVEDALMFVMYFIIASVSGLLISRIRTQQLLINQREKRTASLYNLVQKLSSSKSLDDVTDCAIKQLKEIFNTEVALIYCDDNKRLKSIAHPFSTFNIDGAEWNVAYWVFVNSQKAGRFTNALLITEATYFPLITKGEKLGVIGLLFPKDYTFLPETDSLLNTFLLQISIAVERERLKELNKITLVLAESEKLYKTLFNSISHELKTPITTIIGAISSLVDESISNSPAVRNNLTREINIAAERLNRLVENLLDMTRLESGQMRLKLDWYEITDLIENVLKRLNSELVNHTVKTEIQENIHLFKFDFGLLEQALINVLHNSLIYTPEKSTISISVKEEKYVCKIEVSDNGPGFAEETLGKLFDKFYRIPGTKTGGTGLGLSIAKGFIEAHSGSITAKNRKEGGAVFIINIPMQN